MNLPGLLKFIPVRMLSFQLRQPSGLFGRIFMSRAFTHGNADLNEFIKTLLRPEADDRILEVGFGPGQLIKDLASNVSLVEGLDFSLAMISEASRVNQTHIAAGRVRLQHGDSQAMPYDDKYFDKACTANTIYFWDSPVLHLKEIRRVLKIGGKLVIGFRDREQLDSLPLSNEVFNKYTQGEVESLLASAGFENVSIEKKKGEPFTSYCAIAIRQA